MKKKTSNKYLTDFIDCALNTNELQTILGGQDLSIIEEEVGGFIVEDEIQGI